MKKNFGVVLKKLFFVMLLSVISGCCCERPEIKKVVFNVPGKKQIEGEVIIFEHNKIVQYNIIDQ